MSGQPSYAVVAEDDDGIRVDRWFKRHRPDVTHALVARWARTGALTVDGHKVGPGDRLQAGQKIVIPAVEVAAAPAIWKKAERRPLADDEVDYARSLVIHRDDAALVLNKPPGLATQGGTKTKTHVDGLLDALAFDRPDRPRLVHRLDKDTSGVLLLARSASAAGYFSKAFSGRTAHKVYWALVVGDPQPDAGLINAPLAKMPGTGGEKMTIDAANGQSARTRYRVIERAGTRAAWVEFEPLTGRTHQIRVHAAEALGCPIVGDAKYGGINAFLTGGISRKMHLHARSLTIDHPSGKPLEITAELPPHMAETWAMLGFAKEAPPPEPGVWDPMADTFGNDVPATARPARGGRGGPARARPSAKEAGAEHAKARRLAQRNSRRGARRSQGKKKR
ncbi:RluA family pseudouridine synthase [Parapedomonas caeni]